MHLGKDGEEAIGGIDAWDRDTLDAFRVQNERNHILGYAGREFLVDGNEVCGDAVPCPVVKVELLHVERRRVEVLDRARVKPQVLDWEPVDDIPPLGADIDAMPCEYGEIWEMRECGDDGVYDQERFEMIHVVARWVPLSGVWRDPAVLYCTCDMIVGGIKLETLHCSVEVLQRAESDFILTNVMVGVQEERRDIDYSEEEGLSEVAEDGASECNCA